MRPTTRAPRDGGMVTVEAALAVPALLLVLVLAMGVVTTVAAQLQLVDAARQAARLAARGEPARVVERAGEAAGPRGTTVTLRRRDETVEVTVSATARVLGRLPGIRLRARAVAVSEEP